MIRPVAIIAVPLCALFLSGCSPRDTIVVGSKNFTEQVILGEIAAQQIERKVHIKVERKLNLGGTLLTHEAILKGDIDVYPEYTGTASGVVLKQQIPSDSARAYMLVKDEYLRRFELVWLPPLGFNDTFAMVVRSEDSRRLSRQDLSAASARAWRLGVGYEFLTRPDGLQRFDKSYALRWEGTPRTMDLGLLYQALRQRQIDMAAADSTDAMLTQPEFAVLQDDKRAFPPYSACFIGRESVLRNHAGVEMALTMLSNHISAETMRGLNRQVDVDHRPVTRVVRDFLATQE